MKNRKTLTQIISLAIIAVMRVIFLPLTAIAQSQALAIPRTAQTAYPEFFPANPNN